DGKLQLYASSQKVTGDVTIGGDLATEIGFGTGQDVNVKNIDVTTVAGSQEAIAILDGALKSVDSQRASLGAFQNRFSHAINNLENTNENVNASRSRIQ
ncbi:flagellin, partial [Guyparkeria sp. 1SP6A2]|nr:flagellin [Guyparkeria sp. 1SP6A2]